MSVSANYQSFIQQRQQLMDQTADPALKKHYQAEIDLVKSWGAEDIGETGDQYDEQHQADISEAAVSPYVAEQYQSPAYTPSQTPTTAYTPNHTPATVDTPSQAPATVDTKESKPGPRKPDSAGHTNGPVDGYAEEWNTVRHSNTTGETITMQVTVAAGQPLPEGVDANGKVTIPPGGYVDLTYAPGASVNFKSLKGDGAVWNQGELYFDGASKTVWGNMSYIYGANSNMRIFSSDGQHSGYLGDIMSNAPADAKVGDWGIVAPFDRFSPSDDPNDPDSAAGGPDGAKNAGADYLYDILEKGEGYVGRGRPVEVSDYDDASSLRFTGRIAVVF